MSFDRLPKEKRANLVAFLCQRHGWTPQRAEEELKQLDYVDIAYIGVESRLERSSETQYDPFAEVFKPK